MPPVTKTIGPYLYTVQPLPAMRSFVLQPRLAPALAEVVGALFASAGATSVGDLDVATLAPAVGRFFTKLPPAELEAVTRELLVGTLITGADGKALPLLDVMDVLLVGRTMDLWRVLWFALEANYPDFFSAARANVATPQAQAASSAGSNTLAPPGPAGDSS